MDFPTPLCYGKRNPVLREWIWLVVEIPEHAPADRRLFFVLPLAPSSHPLATELPQRDAPGTGLTPVAVP